MVPLMAYVQFQMDLWESFQANEKVDFLTFGAKRYFGPLCPVHSMEQDS